MANLKDKMNSEENVKNSSGLNESDQLNPSSLPDTMPRSNLQSPESIMQIQSETISQLQTKLDKIIPELEHLKVQGRPKDIAKIQALSSENSNLRSELQKKSENIVYLNDRIATLNGADLVLKENETLVKLNEQLQQSEKEAKAEASGAVRHYNEKLAEKQQELNKAIEATNTEKQKASDIIENYNQKIDLESEKKIKSRIKQLEKESAEKIKKAEGKANSKVAAIYGLTIGSMLYDFVITIMTAVFSERCSSDFVAAVKWVWDYVTGAFRLCLDGASATWNIKDIIPYEYVDVIVAGVLTAIAFVIIFVLVYGIVGLGVYYASKFFIENFADLLSGVVALILLILVVWLADILAWVHINLLLLCLIIYGIFILIRMIYTAYQSNGGR